MSSSLQWKQQLSNWVIIHSENLSQRNPPFLTTLEKETLSKSLKYVKKSIQQIEDWFNEEGAALIIQTEDLHSKELNEYLTEWFLQNMNQFRDGKEFKYPKNKKLIFTKLAQKTQTDYSRIRKWFNNHAKQILVNQNQIFADDIPSYYTNIVNNYIIDNIHIIWLNNYEISKDMITELQHFCKLSCDKITQLLTPHNVKNLFTNITKEKAVFILLNSFVMNQIVISDTILSKLQKDYNYDLFSLRTIQNNVQEKYSQYQSGNNHCCYKCGYYFAFKYDLEEHQSIPHGYVCVYCPRKFINYWTLNKHHYVKHQQKEFCPKCLIIKGCSAYQWAKHVLRKHNFVCNFYPDCPCMFVRISDLKVHLQENCEMARIQYENNQKLIVNHKKQAITSEQYQEEFNNMLITINNSIKMQPINKSNKHCFNIHVVDIIKLSRFTNINMNYQTDIEQPYYYILQRLMKIKFVKNMHLFDIKYCNSLTESQLHILFLACNANIRESVNNFADGILEVNYKELANKFCVNCEKFTAKEEFVDCVNRNYKICYSTVNSKKLKSFVIKPNVFLSPTTEIFVNNNFLQIKITFIVPATNTYPCLKIIYMDHGRIFKQFIYLHWIQKINYCIFVDEDQINCCFFKVEYYQSIYFMEMFPNIQNETNKSENFGRIPFDNNKNKYKKNNIILFVKTLQQINNVRRYFYNYFHREVIHSLQLQQVNLQNYRKLVLNPVKYNDQQYNYEFNKMQSVPSVHIKELLIYTNRHNIKWCSSKYFDKCCLSLNLNPSKFSSTFYSKRIEHINQNKADFLPLPVQTKFKILNILKQKNKIICNIPFYPHQTQQEIKFLFKERCEPDYVCCVCNKMFFEENISICFLFEHMPKYQDQNKIQKIQFSPQSIIGQTCKSCKSKLHNSKQSTDVVIHYGDYGPFIPKLKKLNVMQRAQLSSINTTMNLKRAKSYSGRPTFLQASASIGHSLVLRMGKYDSTFGIPVQKIDKTIFQNNFIAKEIANVKLKQEKRAIQFLKCHLCKQVIINNKFSKKLSISLLKQYEAHLQICFHNSAQMQQVNSVANHLKRYGICTDKIFFKDYKEAIISQALKDSRNTDITSPVYRGLFIQRNPCDNITCTIDLPENNKYGIIYELSRFYENLKNYKPNEIIIGFKENTNIQIYSTDKKFEKYRFPYLYVKYQNNTFDYHQNITLSKYIKQRLNETDERFLLPEYIMEMYNVVQTKALHSYQIISVNGNFMNSSFNIYDKDAKSLFDIKDEAINNVVSHVKYSEFWWKLESQKLFHKVAHFGEPGYMLTCTFNPDDPVVNILLRKHPQLQLYDLPVQLMKIVKRKWDLFFKYILIDKQFDTGIFHKETKYWARVEQNHGEWPHLHILIWCQMFLHHVIKTAKYSDNPFYYLTDVQLKRLNHVCSFNKCLIKTAFGIMCKNNYPFKPHIHDEKCDKNCKQIHREYEDIYMSAYIERILYLLNSVMNISVVNESKLVEYVTKLIKYVTKFGSDPIDIRKFLVGNMQFQCLYCNQIFTQNVSKHLEKCIGDKSYRCLKCNTIMKTSKEMWQHLHRCTTTKQKKNIKTVSNRFMFKGITEMVWEMLSYSKVLTYNFPNIVHLKIFYPWKTPRYLAPKSIIIERLKKKGIEIKDNNIPKHFTKDHRECFLNKNQFLRWLDRPKEFWKYNFVEFYEKCEYLNGKWKNRKQKALVHVDEAFFAESPEEWYWYKIITSKKTLWTSLKDCPSKNSLKQYLYQHKIIDLETETKKIIQTSLQHKPTNSKIFQKINNILFQVKEKCNTELTMKELQQWIVKFNTCTIKTIHKNIVIGDIKVLNSLKLSGKNHVYISATHQILYSDDIEYKHFVLTNKYQKFQQKKISNICIVIPLHQYDFRKHTQIIGGIFFTQAYFQNQLVNYKNCTQFIFLLGINHGKKSNNWYVYGNNRYIKLYQSQIVKFVNNCNLPVNQILSKQYSFQYKPSVSKPLISQLTSEQQRILYAVLQHKQSIFITGGPGTGKTAICKYIINYLRNIKKKNVVSVAASCSAAQHIDINGFSIQRFFGINKPEYSVNKILDKLKQIYNSMSSKQQFKSQFIQILETYILIIEEASMIDADLFEKMAYIMQSVKQSNKLWGGTQIIVCGDIHQNAPHSQPLKYCFESDIFTKSCPFTYQLTKSKRHTEQTEQILQQIRKGKLSDSHKKILNKQCITDKQLQQLTKTNKRITYIFNNRKKIEQLTSEKMQKCNNKDLYEYIPKMTKWTDDQNRFAKPFILKTDLDVKVNRNIYHDKYVIPNGTLGKITDFTYMDLNGIPQIYPVVSLQHSSKETIIPYTAYKKHIVSTTIGCVETIPLEPIIAQTIEGIQGLEFVNEDHVLVAEMESFKKFGSFYTYISRTQNINQIYFLNNNKNENHWNAYIKTHPFAIKFQRALDKRNKNDYKTPNVKPITLKAFKKYHLNFKTYTAKKK